MQALPPQETFPQQPAKRARRSPGDGDGGSAAWLNLLNLPPAVSMVGPGQLDGQQPASPAFLGAQAVSGGWGAGGGSAAAGDAGPPAAPAVPAGRAYQRVLSNPPPRPASPTPAAPLLAAYGGSCEIPDGAALAEAAAEAAEPGAAAAGASGERLRRAFAQQAQHQQQQPGQMPPPPARTTSLHRGAQGGPPAGPLPGSAAGHSLPTPFAPGARGGGAAAGPLSTPFAAAAHGGSTPPQQLPQQQQQQVAAVQAMQQQVAAAAPGGSCGAAPPSITGSGGLVLPPDVDAIESMVGGWLGGRVGRWGKVEQSKVVTGPP